MKDDWPIFLIIVSVVLIFLGLAMSANGAQAGQYCKTANAGAVTTSNSGNTIKCILNGSRYRWTKAASSTVKPAPKKANPNRALNLKIKKLTKQLKSKNRIIKAKNKAIAARNKKNKSLNERVDALLSEIGELNAFVESLKVTYGVS